MSIEAQRTERSTSVRWTPSTPSVEKATASTAPLTPDPNPPSLDGMQDAMSMMFALVAKQGQSQMASGEVGVRAQNEQQQSQAQQEAAALKQQEADEAKLNCGSLFGSIFHVIDSVIGDVTHGRIFDAPADAVSGAVNIVDSPELFTQLEQLAPQAAEYVGIAAACVGAAAFTAATCGTGGIVVAAVVIALSAGGMFVSDTKCLGKDSAYIGLGMDIAASVVSCGASMSMDVDAAMKVASAGAQVVSGATDVVGGAASIVVAHQQADVMDDTANVQQAMAAITRNQRMVAVLIAGMKDAQQSNTSALQTLGGAVHTYNQTLTLASAGKA
jgi:hypothetical protein